MLCPLPQVHAINISAIFVNFRIEIFSEMQKFSRKCENKNFRFNPDDSLNLTEPHVRYVLFTLPKCNTM
jgi:hypothetical protein